MTRASSIGQPAFGGALAAAKPLIEASLDRAADRLTAKIGMTFPGGRRARLRTALATVAAEAGLADIDALLGELDRQPLLLERLIHLVTIGETYFFRHSEQLEVLSRRILPSLMAEGGDAGRAAIRVWCAGCSTGEEAYSLAILVKEAIGSRSGWEVRIAATDIDEAALRQARTASYGRWSFRAELGERGRWFEADGPRRQVRASVAQAVMFSADNLTLEDVGAPPALGGPADVIVCRNVTMYFSAAARRRVAARFLRALAPGGWLVLAPVELSSTVYSGFDTAVLEGLTFYRRPLGNAIERMGTAPTMAHTAGFARSRRALASDASGGDSRIAAPGDPAARAKRSSPAFEHPLRPPSARSRGHEPVARLMAARLLANQGLLTEARREAELATLGDPLGRPGYVLLASIADAQGDLAAAAAALRRAVYLDRTDATAQFQLGLLDWRLGRKGQARARLAAALAIVADRTESEMVDEGSDLTVGRLRSTVELLADG